MNTKASPLAQSTAARQQAADTSDIVPTTPTMFPARPGVSIVVVEEQGLYKIVQSADINASMQRLRSRTSFPLRIVAWLPGTYKDSKRQQNHLRYIFKRKSAGDGWFRLSASDRKEAVDYLAEDRQRIAREAERARTERAMVLERAVRDKERALNECVLLINRLRNLAHVVRCFIDNERRTIHEWPGQALTDECLEIVDGFGSALEELDLELSRSAMEMQLALLLKKNRQRSK